MTRKGSNGLRVAVLGGGPGGAAAAVTLASRASSVSLWNRAPARVADYQRRGGIPWRRESESGFTRLGCVTTDIEEAMDGVDLVLSTVPAFAQIDVLDVAEPFLTDDMALLFAPGCGASLEAARRLGTELDISSGLLLGEAAALPRFGVTDSEGNVRLGPLARMWCAAFPASRTGEMVDRWEKVIEVHPAEHVLETALHNPNFVLHPGPMVVNYATVERTDGRLALMGEGMTQSALHLADAVDAEKAAVCRALGLPAISIDDLYMAETGHDEPLFRSPRRRSLADRVPDRYLTEDVPYGVVMFASLGAALGVQTPVCNAIAAVLSAATGVDFIAIGRTTERLGLDRMTVAEMGAYLESGTRTS